MHAIFPLRPVIFVDRGASATWRDRRYFYGYVQNLANYNLMYGGIAIAVVLLVWGWVAAFITILSGEMASHFQTMVLEGAGARTVDRKRMHLRNVKKYDAMFSRTTTSCALAT